MDKINQKINLVLAYNGHPHSDSDMEMTIYGPVDRKTTNANDIKTFGHPNIMDPNSNFMGGGYALPYGVMSPAMMGYGGMGFGMGFPGGMPMGAYNYPDKQDDAQERLLREKYLKV